MNLSLVHVHLLTNHIPVIGLPIVAAILIAALVMRSNDVAKVGYLSLVVIAILSIIPYSTGDAAGHAVRNIEGVTRAAIREHDDSAGWAFDGTIAIGVIALWVLWRYRREAIPRKWIGIGVALVLFVSSIMARTAWLGGIIRHTEIRGDSSVAK